jgi:hypothetical protein
VGNVLDHTFDSEAKPKGSAITHFVLNFEAYFLVEVGKMNESCIPPIFPPYILYLWDRTP